MESYVLLFRSIALRDLPRVGGKNANLGELIANLTAAGVRVPDGFAVTADAFRRHLADNRLLDVYDALDRVDPRDVVALARTAAEITEIITIAHRHGRKVGLCGQGPSDHPEIASFLAAAGIDSISVTPDALPRVLRHLAAAPAPSPVDETC